MDCLIRKGQYELQILDSNCNDCGLMTRDIEKLNVHKHSFGNYTRDNLNFGVCSRFNKNVSFVPSICQIETQECFIHR